MLILFFVFYLYYSLLFLFILLFLLFFIGPQLKTEGSIKSVSSVRSSVRMLVTAYRKKRSNNFSDFLYEVRYPQGLNRHRAAFLTKGLGWEKMG